MLHLPGAETAFVLDIVTLRHRWNACRCTSQLAAVLQDDLGVLVIFFDVSFDFDNPAFELTDIADVPQVAAKDDYLEWAGPVIFAEIEESRTGVETSNFDYFAADALAGAHVLGCLGEGNTFGGEQARSHDP